MVPNLNSVLVVDDNEANRSLLYRYLTRRGYIVTGADGGIQALELVEKQTFDLVLLDVMMPDIDGFSVLTTLRQTHPAMELPIIMVTANSESDTIVKALSIGANDYVTKPLDLPVVLARVRTQLLRKEAEEALRHAKEVAEEATRLKSEFLATMSHELRTPLTVILGNLPPLSDASCLPEPQEILAIVHDIQSAGSHLLTLVNDLLDLSKIEAGRMTLRAMPLSTHTAVAETASAVQVMARAKGLTIDTQVEDLEVHADPLRLHQILLNLLSNAIKFTDEGVITIAVTPADDMAHFRITDSGCGIPETCLPYIFDKFRQADGSSTRAVGGTGLGLAITRELITMHGGDITVESTLDQGSTFAFKMPLASEYDNGDIPSEPKG